MMSLYLYFFIVNLIVIAISSWFIKKKAGKIVFIISIILMLFIIFMYFRHDIIFFVQSLKYQDTCNYDYSNDISTYGYITENGAIKIALEDTDSSRIAQVECKLNEEPLYKLDDNNYFDMYAIMDEKSLYESTYGKEKYDRMKKVTKYWSISFVTGWDRACRHYEEHIFTIDYYTGEIFDHLQTM